MLSYTSLFYAAPGFERKAYDGLQIQYSGFNGEQHGEGSLGHEYILIEGVLPRTFSLRVLGHQSGTADVTYSWGYYATAMSIIEGGDGATLEAELHEIIHDHKEVTYTPGCWEALRVRQRCGSFAHLRQVHVFHREIIHSLAPFLPSNPVSTYKI